MSQPQSKAQSDHPATPPLLTRTRSTQSISAPVAYSASAAHLPFAPHPTLVHAPRHIASSRFAPPHPPSPPFASGHSAPPHLASPHFSHTIPYPRAPPPGAVYVTGVVHDNQQSHLPLHPLHYHPQPLPTPHHSAPFLHHHHYARRAASQSPPSTPGGAAAPTTSASNTSHAPATSVHRMHYVAQQPTPGHLTIMSARHAATAPPSQLHPMAYQYYAVPPPQPYPMYYPHPYRMAPSSPYTGPVVTARGPPRGGASAYAGATLRPPERGAPPWRAPCASDGGNARGNAAICDSTRSTAGTYATLGIVSPSRAIAKRTPARRKRLKWTDELHQKFLSAIEDVGTETAVPKALMLAMDVPGLTRENIASHLQKYRQRVKGQGSTASEPHGSGARADSERASSELAGNKSLPERASGSGGASSNGNQDTAADASAKGSAG